MMRVVDRIRSLELARIIVRTLAKVRDLLRGGFLGHVESYGLARAVGLVEVAVGWGNSVFGFGLGGFARYLAFVDLITRLGGVVFLEV
jgi:hypothetical protein